MAGFRTHVTVSSGLGVAVGAAAVNPLGYSPEAGFLAATVTAVGGMLPDLDSDSGIPLRETFSLAAAVSPLVLLPRFEQIGLSREGTVAGCVLAYLFVRYVGANTVRLHVSRDGEEIHRDLRPPRGQHQESPDRPELPRVFPPQSHVHEPLTPDSPSTAGAARSGPGRASRME